MLKLKYFSVANYRGFKNPIEWDLSRVAPFEHHSEAVRDGVVNNGIIYGPNGSGKSNLSLSVFDIVHHLSQKMRDRDYYANYVYAGAAEQPVRLTYVFCFDGHDLRYQYAKRADGWLVEEELSLDGKVMIARRSDHVALTGMELELSPSVLEQFRQGANNVSIVSYLLSKVSLPADHYLMLLQQFVDAMLWFHGRESWQFIGLENDATNLNKFINQNGHLSEFASFLKEMSGQDFRLVGDPNNDNLFYAQIESALVPFDLIASTGTRELKLLFYWAKRMQKASLVFIDEFDAFYHFRLSKQICRHLFGMDNQLFLTTHNTALMTHDLLRPDCYFVIGGGQIKSLCDATHKDLQGDYNLERLYRGGTFAL